jgi:spermidine/putrescine ABC transporter ATP-binding subunit
MPDQPQAASFAQGTTAEVVLRLTGVSKSFGSVHAVQDFALDVQRNELVTLLGPSGCGKTTTLRMVAGFEYPTAGRIFIDGEDVTYLPANKREIGLVFQSYSLFPHIKVADNVGYGLRRRGVPREEARQRIAQALEMVDLAALAGRYPSELSGGQQQRVALARALVIRPKILLLDEPLSALDAKLRQRMRFEIRALQQYIGMTTVLVTHDQEEALAMSDRIVVMNAGHTEQIGSPAEIYQAPRTPFVASFVGETNLFHGSITGPAPTEGFSIFAANEGFEACVTSRQVEGTGTKVLMSLRPEMLSIRRENDFMPGAKNMLKGTIAGISYLGARTVVQVETASSRLLASVPNETASGALAGLSKGDAVTVTWAHESCRVVRDA